MRLGLRRSESYTFSFKRKLFGSPPFSWPETSSAAYILRVSFLGSWWPPRYLLIHVITVLLLVCPQCERITCSKRGKFAALLLFLPVPLYAKQEEVVRSQHIGREESTLASTVTLALDSRSYNRNLSSLRTSRWVKFRKRPSRRGLEGKFSKIFLIISKTVQRSFPLRRHKNPSKFYLRPN